MEQHECSIVKEYTQMDICREKFANVTEAIHRIEKSLVTVRNMIWGQITAIVVTLIGFVLTQIK